MTSSTRSVRDHLAALAAWDGVDVSRMSADDALAAAEIGGQALSALQGLVARFAARVDVVCEQSPGMAGYARRHGYASGPALVAAVAGLAPGEANRLAAMGRALLEADAGAARAERGAVDAVRIVSAPKLEPDAALDWNSAPEVPVLRPVVERELAAGEYLTRAIDAGRIGAAHAEVIRATLADFTIDSRNAEREFVDFARTVGLRKLKQHCFWRLGELDPTGLAIREERQSRERFVSIGDSADGMVTIIGKLPVAWAAPIKTLLDTMTSSALRRQRNLPVGERLQPGQLCADALADIALHALSCENVPRRPKTTVVVRASYDQIVDDLRDVGRDDAHGLVTCDGILQPMTPGTARLMAVEAQLLPAVMGGASLPLDLGRARRLFTKAQSIAVVDRDQGCIRCAAPPLFTQQHHIRFWSDDGKSDLSNAVTLCTSCHHRLHEQRWRLELVGDRDVVKEREPARSARHSPPRVA